MRVRNIANLDFLIMMLPGLFFPSKEKPGISQVAQGRIENEPYDSSTTDFR